MKNSKILAFYLWQGQLPVQKQIMILFHNVELLHKISSLTNVNISQLTNGEHKKCLYFQPGQLRCGCDFTTFCLLGFAGQLAMDNLESHMLQKSETVLATVSERLSPVKSNVSVFSPSCHRLGTTTFALVCLSSISTVLRHRYFQCLSHQRISRLSSILSILFFIMQTSYLCQALISICGKNTEIFIIFDSNNSEL